MILGSHNSWSYLPVKQWWLRPFSFIAKCQDVDIKTQYENYDVRCFDLRLRFDKNKNLYVVHGLIKYQITEEELLYILNYLNSKKDCWIRVIHDVRNKYYYNDNESFIEKCKELETKFPNIKFWNGEDLLERKVRYDFKNNPRSYEIHSSVTKPGFVTPRTYAKWNNVNMLTLFKLALHNNSILLIDFVNINK